MTAPIRNASETTDDEMRLLMFFRALSLSEQFKLLLVAGEQAWERCLPERDYYDFMPTVDGARPEVLADSVWDESVVGTIVEVIRDGIEATGEPFDYLLGSDAYDANEAVPRFVAAARETASRQGSGLEVNRAFARKYLADWRMNIARSCFFRTTKMAKSVAEAEVQQFEVPDSVDNWIGFALMLDGDRIARELGWTPPGQHDCDLRGSIAEYDQPPTGVPEKSPISRVLRMRIGLYQRLRFLQARKRLPADDEQVEEIAEVLSWIRTQIRR